MLLCAGLGARAETRFPIVPPWLDDDRDRGAQVAAEIKRLPPPAIHRAAQPNSETPAAPVLTPADTRAMIEKLDREERPSALEDSYSARIVDQLSQFGYDVFGNKPPARAPATGLLPSGAVQDDFILDRGDKLTVTFRGQRDDSQSYTINNQGFLIVDDLPPISAAGRPMAQIRTMLEDQAAKLHNTDIYVSLDSVRQIGVLVLGDVGRPGRQNLTVFHTLIDALMGGGGR